MATGPRQWGNADKECSWKIVSLAHSALLIFFLW